MKSPIGSNLDKIFFNHLVYIKNEVTDEFGTGTLIKNDKNTFIITAAHVIKKALKNGDLYLNLGIGYHSRLDKYEIIVRDNEYDVALIQVDNFESEIKLGEKNTPFLFKSKKILKECPEMNRITITGYPNELITESVKYPERIYFSIWNKYVTPFEDWPKEIKSKLDKDSWMLIDFHPSRTEPFQDRHGNTCDIFDLYGMSGCPVWLLNKDTINDVQPIYGFYGIFVGFYPVNKMWIFVRIDAILNLLSIKYGIDLI